MADGALARCGVTQVRRIVRDHALHHLMLLAQGEGDAAAFRAAYRHAWSPRVLSQLQSGVGDACGGTSASVDDAVYAAAWATILRGRAPPGFIAAWLAYLPELRGSRTSPSCVARVPPRAAWLAYLPELRGS
eukprot:gene17988-18411_t